ncbi:MAG TPA: hypothetical protein DEB30_03340 [Candidatus Peribacter riflensis]|uniref:Uncharacterized protein n=1 Tax=Candidatus Peribacter riflensis TaxID=1735162 RepID=A0A0S1SPL3_9BACT|nr:MAG: hypothetical protein PeribacterA2_0682 [Candidatus Peribacter riflensis]OGJ79003.1 MAG: hypothetical protein A2398_04875 [Candidatus Peribacteria bacterium RIFOXYB1_FULL_57_12]ALM11152.1 MAG: hypothetical protein PeribacterB2_0683 [Candidatus Peribacter riflensis]ALM12255.1 MAG: hypothetical protein PeribacterC2_0683 [Candidatus Peribacter riflensis]ALM13357.1 MAG: hypothetical protein PeribacterD1_0683 [Candidatus Peribacter riflensis]
MKRSRLSVYAMTGLLTVVIAIPLSTALLKEQGGHYSQTLQDEALGNQAESRATRRALTRLNARCGRVGEKLDAACEAYAIVQQECIDRQDQYFQNTGCPTLNDMVRIAAVQRAIEMKQPIPAIGKEVRSSSSASAHAAAGGLTIKDLAPSDRLAMRRAIRVQYCSKKLPTAMYVLCTSLVRELQDAAPTGLTNDLQQIRTLQRSSLPSTLKDRIEMTVPVER